MSYVGNAASPQALSYLQVSSQAFDGDGSTTGFTLNRYVSAAKDIEVVVNNVQQSPYDGSYSVSGTTLTFSEAPSSGTDNIYVTYRDYPIGSVVPADNSVSTSKLADDAVTAAKISNTEDFVVNGLTVGKGAGNVTTNTAVGLNALAANTTGSNNAAVGYAAMDANTTGSSNTAIGRDSLGSNTTGLYNTAVGRNAAATNTSGEQITAVGYNALIVNTANHNTAVGSTSLQANTTGATNTAVGSAALYSNTTASNNTAVGYQAGYSQTTARWNTFIGSQSGYSVTTGEGNTFVGNGYSPAGYSITTGSKNTIIGGYTGNAGGLDIRTSSNYIVLSDGDGNPRGIFDASGDFLVGTVTDNLAGTSGCKLIPEGTIAATRSSDYSGYFNRLTNDGELVVFVQGGTQEGSISVSGTTVSYNGGHLSRYAQTVGAKDETLVKGTVLSNLDEMNVYIDADGNPVDNEQLNKVKVSDVEGDANVAGVFVDWSYDKAHSVDEINMAMTGDMIIRIAQGVTVQRGDLLMSAGDGTAKPQEDDVVRSKTIAKVTSTHVTCTYADGSYCVPCVLMAC